MGANAVTTVPVYTAGEVLTAANMNITNSGIPVFATTVTRDAAFGGSGEKTLAEGQFAYIEATNTTQYYDGAAWQSVGVAPGLVLVKTQTIGTTVATVAVSDAFSATYDAYQIVISGGVSSAAGNELEFQLTGSTTGYNFSFIYTTFNATVSGLGVSNGSKFQYVGCADTNGLSMNLNIVNPFLAKYTTCNAPQPRTDIAGNTTGIHKVATSYTGFTILPSSGTLTGGTIRVYGYANS